MKWRDYEIESSTPTSQLPSHTHSPEIETKEISISERRGLEEIIAFNRNKTDQHIEKWQYLY